MPHTTRWTPSTDTLTSISSNLWFGRGRRVTLTWDVQWEGLQFFFRRCFGDSLIITDCRLAALAGCGDMLVIEVLVTAHFEVQLFQPSLCPHPNVCVNWPFVMSHRPRIPLLKLGQNTLTQVMVCNLFNCSFQACLTSNKTSGSQNKMDKTVNRGLKTSCAF